MNGESMTAYTHDPASSSQSKAFGSNAKKFEDKRVWCQTVAARGARH